MADFSYFYKEFKINIKWTHDVSKAHISHDYQIL